MVASLLQDELSDSRGIFHRVPGRAEPMLPRLLPSSVCLAILSHLKKGLNVEDSAMLQCLQVLSQSKILPPCDMSFLSQLATQAGYRHLCYRISASQASVSPSARAVTEEFVKTLYTQTSQVRSQCLGI